MKIIETQTTPQFKPVTFLLETPEELQYLTKLVGMGSVIMYRKFTGDNDCMTEPSFEIYTVLSEECAKQDIEADNTYNYGITKH